LPGYGAEVEGGRGNAHTAATGVREIQIGSGGDGKQGAWSPVPCGVASCLSAAVSFQTVLSS